MTHTDSTGTESPALPENGSAGFRGAGNRHITMNMNHTKHVTIGVCPFFSLSVTQAIHNRRVRDAANARRRAYVARITGFTSICNFALALRKKFA